MLHPIFTQIVLSVSLLGISAHAQSAAPKVPEKVVIDTDIGDDIDDAFAVALALRSPELQILGISTTFGDTTLRARVLDRLLGEVGRDDIPVAVGSPTQTVNSFTQRPFAERGAFARASHPDATEFILDEIRRYPNEITLIAIGPLVNVGALIDKDPETFRKLRRVVLMGGSIERSYGDLGYAKPRGPEPEWNIKNDIPSARKLFASGVPIFMMPLDSTQLKLDEVKREFLFRAGTPLTDALTILYHQWGGETPTMFDPLAVAYSIDPELCPTKPMRIRIDDQGFTRVEPGAPNANVCLDSESDTFFHFYIPRVTGHLISPQVGSQELLNVVQQITRLEQERSQAQVRGDLSKLNQLLAPEFVEINAAGDLRTKTENVQAHKEGQVHWKAFDLNNLKVEVYGNTAIVTGHLSRKGTFAGRDVSGRSRYTRYYLKRNGEWQAVFQHGIPESE